MQMKELLEKQDFEELMAEARWPARRAVTRHVRPVARRVSAPVRRINQAPIKPQAIRTPPRCPPCAPCTPCPSPKISQPQLGPVTKKPTLSPYQPTLKSEVVRNQSPSKTTPQLRSNYSTAQKSSDKDDKWA